MYKLFAYTVYKSCTGIDIKVVDFVSNAQILMSYTTVHEKL